MPRQKKAQPVAKKQRRKPVAKKTSKQVVKSQPRITVPLNISTQPGVGMGYIIRDLETGKRLRASTTCQRDLNRKDLGLTKLRSFTGENPFFTAKIGSLNTGFTLLTFLCAASQSKKCIDSTGKYQWTEMSLSEARANNVKFDESNYYVSGERKEQPVKTKTVKAKTKKVKATVAKVTKKVRKARMVKEAVAAAAAGTEQVQIPETVTPETIAPEDMQPIEQTQPEQTDQEFEADDIQAQLAAHRTVASDLA